MLLVALAASGAGLFACGRYGTPIRDEKYLQEEEEQARAAAEKKRQTTPQERNDPMPAAP
jgi:hypothetical protein